MDDIDPPGSYGIVRLQGCCANRRANASAETLLGLKCPRLLATARTIIVCAVVKDA